MAKPVRTLDTFRGEHDDAVKIPRLIRNALEALGKEHGKEAWEEEGEFIKRVGRGVGNTKFAMYREEFKDYFVEVKGKDGRNNKRIWFADRSVAKRALTIK